MQPQKPIRGQALIDLLDETDDELDTDIYIFPPDNATGEVTDEDSGDEEGSGNIDNLPGSMLRAEANFVRDSHSDVDINSESAEYDIVSQDISTPSETTKRAKRACATTCDQPTKRNKKAIGNRSPRLTKEDLQKELEKKWKRRDLKPKENPLPDNFEELPVNVRDKKGKLNPSEFFELFFTEELIDLIAQQTNKYATECRNKVLNVTPAEIRCVLAVLMLSGYNPLPRRRLYWETAVDVHHQLVSDAISRNRFSDIFSSLHFADNKNLDQNDKFAKVRPLFDILNSQFLENAPHTENHSFDESMCEYFGKHGCKQCIRNKPIRFGFKIFIGSLSTGYITWMDPYQGAGTSGVVNRGLGVGGDLVAHYAHHLLDRESMQYHLYIDNWFNSFKLMVYLKSINVKATGTVKRNRTEMCPIKSADDLKKMQRGACDFRVHEDEEILVASWLDNGIVNVISNESTICPETMVSRYSVASKSRIQVKQPSLITQYNKHMGGVDLFDQNLNAYRVGIRGRKWYSSIVTYLVDAAVSNSWILYRYLEDNPTLDLLAFRRSIVVDYLKKYGSGGVSRAVKNSLKKRDPSRYDGRNHLLIPQEKQTRCGLCGMKTTSRCQKCDVGLHLKCNLEYHTGNE